MDKRIIWFAVIIVLIGGGLFAVRLFWGRTPSDLKQLDFTVSSRTIYVEDSVEFRDNTSGARQWNWDFGDPGGVPDIRKRGWYRFVTAGRYTLRLTVNGKTTDSSITIVSIRGTVRRLAPGYRSSVLRRLMSGNRRPIRM